MCSGNLLESDEVLTDVGFRTPTGDIYGRVTFENGQAVAGAKVTAEPTEGSGVPGKSYVFSGTSKLTVDNESLLKDATKAATPGMGTSRQGRYYHREAGHVQAGIQQPAY